MSVTCTPNCPFHCLVGVCHTTTPCGQSDACLNYYLVHIKDEETDKIFSLPYVRMWQKNIVAISGRVYLGFQCKHLAFSSQVRRIISLNRVFIYTFILPGLRIGTSYDCFLLYSHMHMQTHMCTR